MSTAKIIGTVIIAVGGSLGGSAFVGTATACAEPDREWDIGAYDRCIHSGLTEDVPSGEQAWLDHQKYCCLKSGGDWNAGTQACQAPAAEPAQRPGVVDPGVATQTFVPALPPVRNPGVATQTFAPAPVG